MTKIKELFQSSGYSKIIYTLGILLSILIVFSAGVSVGQKRADFSCKWDKNYYANMSRERDMFAPFGHGEDRLNPHGAFGEIISINLPNIIVRGPNQAEQIVTIGSSTMVKNLRSDSSPKMLKVGDPIVVIGIPDGTGKIQAKLIRIAPPPPDKDPQTIFGSSSPSSSN